MLPRRTQAQSMVEMALIAPLLFALLFAIIDFGYYIWGYSTLFQAARNGAEVAAQLPPYPEMLAVRDTNPSAFYGDPCVGRIIQAADDKTNNFPVPDNQVTIRYPPRIPADPNPRAMGKTIEIEITYEIQPLTPLWHFFGVMIGQNGVMSVQATAQRTIESLGNNPNYADGIACTKPT